MPVGNDIVSWQHPRCVGKSAHARFLDKICSDKEKEKIATDSIPDLCLWKYWTLKEAAYKLSCFLGNRQHFHGLDFEVMGRHDAGALLKNPFHLPWDHQQLQKGVEGFFFQEENIRWKDMIFYGCSWANDEMIHSLVFDNPLEYKNAIWGIAATDRNDKNDYSNAVRLFALQSLKKLAPADYTGSWILKDKDGIPMLMRTEEEWQWMALSHDQRLLAFAIGAEY
jgi:hypothetical protein